MKTGDKVRIKIKKSLIANNGRMKNSNCLFDEDIQRSFDDYLDKVCVIHTIYDNGTAILSHNGGVIKQWNIPLEFLKVVKLGKRVEVGGTYPDIVVTKIEGCNYVDIVMTNDKVYRDEDKWVDFGHYGEEENHGRTHSRLYKSEAIALRDKLNELIG